MLSARRWTLVTALCVAVIGCAGDVKPGQAPSQTPAPPAPAATPDPDAPWVMTWHDEFDVPGAPDSANWSFETGAIRNNELQWYTERRENARVEDGHLIIEARKDGWQGHAYTSASLHTRGKHDLRYGRVEVRAQLPTGRGTWPAIWLLGTNISSVGWPTCGEIDVMENVGFEPETIHGSVHTRAYNHVQGNARTATTQIATPWEQFHVYAIEWSPAAIDFFVDGRRFFRFENEGTGNAAWPFDQPQYLIINLAIGGSWGGQQGVDDTLFPHQYLIDYVRVYQRERP